MTPEKIQAKINSLFENDIYVVLDKEDVELKSDVTIECQEHKLIGEFRLQNIVYKNTIPCKRCSRAADKRFVATASFQTSEPYSPKGTIWEPYVNDLKALNVEFPKMLGQSVFVHKVELDDLGETCKRFFFVEVKGMIHVVGEDRQFPSPKELITWFKSSECSRDFIIKKREVEKALRDEED